MSGTPVMDQSLFRYIWRHTRQQQAWILTIVVASMPLYFLALDLPKRIVNGPIQGQGFETAGATQSFLGFEMTLPSLLGGGTWSFEGFSLERLDMLVALSLTFLALVCINGLFKFYINTYKGRLGERMLRRLRYELVDRVLRFPYLQFRRIRAPEIATMVKDEVEPLGGFIGDAYVSPVFLGGQALTAMLFIVLQNYWLGLIAGGVVFLQAVIIPKLRRRLLELGKERQLTARELAGRVGEIVDSIADVRTNDTSNFERAGISSRLGRIFSIRYEFYQRKFFVKFLNNFLAQVTPFLFYLVGGYFAIQGSLDIGQLVAVIAAYKDLPSPIKELIDWDQRRLDVEIKYGQVIEQFAPDGMIDADVQRARDLDVAPLTKPIVIDNVTMVDDTGGKLLEDASITIKPGAHIATVGEVNSGAEALAEALARLHPPARGRILINDEPIETLPEAITGRRIAYLSSEPILHNTSLKENLLYGLKHGSAKPGTKDDVPLTAFDIAEATASGNPLPDAARNWIDFSTAGVADFAELRVRLGEVLKLVGLESDVVDLGLRSTIDTELHDDWSKQILQARAAMKVAVEAPENAGLIEVFDPQMYNQQMTIGGNILFGRARKAAFEADELAENPFVRDLLQTSGLDARLFTLGREIADTMIELFADLEPGNSFLEQMAFMSPDELPSYRSRLSKEHAQSYETASADDQAAFLRLALAYIEPQHRLGLIHDALRDDILAAREQVFETLPATDAAAVAFYDPDAFNPGSSLQDNILFGRAAYGISKGPETLRKIFRGILDDLEMNGLVFEAGLEFSVGSGGRRLTSSQRQRVGLARALLKRPDLLIVNRGLNALSARSQSRVMARVLKSGTGRAKEDRASFATFWVLMNPHNAMTFDEVLVFESGRLVEHGNPKTLAARDSRFATLVT